MKKVIFILLALLGWAASVSAATSYDYSDDFQAYREEVATLNKEGKRGLLRKSSSMYAVLLRTNGVEPDVPEDELKYIIRGPENRYTLYYSSAESAAEAAERLSAKSGILYAEADSEVEMTEYAFNSWGAERLGYASYLPYANTWGSGSALVAVIDSGVYPHDLIAPKMTESGYDYVEADEDATNDENGHGTHVAGIIADCTRDAPVGIYPIRVLKADGRGKMSNIVLAVAEARQKGVDVINLSVESKTASEALDYEIREAVSAGCVVVCAAGNSNIDTSTVWPAHLTDEGFIVVGSVDERSGDVAKASYSNYGDSVDVYAFGTSIVSCSITNEYSTRSGTSQATPHVSAECALLRLLHPGLTPVEIEARVKAGATVVSGLPVPDLDTMIPASEGFNLEQIVIEADETMTFFTEARPTTACEAITYSSSDPSVVSVEDGTVSAVAEGTAVVTASCTGIPDSSFEVVVTEDGGGTIEFPSALTTLEDEALLEIGEPHKVILPNTIETIGASVFQGENTLVYVPASVESIGTGSFAGAVLICPEGSYAASYAQESGMQYILQ